MQELHFESAWDKTLSDKDRKEIHDVFHSTERTDIDDLVFVPLWGAFNHKGDLLISVLIHNYTNTVLSFNNKHVQYIENDNVVAEHHFTFSVTINPKTSSPWTFIFPSNSINQEPTFETGELVLQS